MSRPLNATWVPLSPINFGPNRSIKAGTASGSTQGELTNAANLNWLHANTTPPIVLTLFNSDAGYIEGASTTATVRATWRRKVFRDLTTIRCSAYVENPSTTTAGEVQFRMTSDNLLRVVLSVPANTPQWTQVTGTFNYNPAVGGGIDGIEMLVDDPSGTDHIKVRSVTIYPEPLGSIGAGVTTEGIVPFDSDEFGADKPLAVHLRQAEIDNCEVLRKTRSDTFVSFSEDALVRTPATYAAYKVSSATYTVVALIPFRTLPGQTILEWSLAGYYSGASGSVRLRTQHMIDQGYTVVEQALDAAGAWTAPYPFHDTGATALRCLPNQEDYLEVALKGDGASNAYLMALNVWAQDI